MGKIHDIIHIYSGIKHGWETPELHGGFHRTIIEINGELSIDVLDSSWDFVGNGITHITASGFPESNE